MNLLVHNYYTRDAYYHVHADPWYTTRWHLDLGGSIVMWLGAALYFVACFSLAYKVRRTPVPAPLPVRWALTQSASSPERGASACPIPRPLDCVLLSSAPATTTITPNAQPPTPLCNR